MSVYLRILYEYYSIYLLDLEVLMCLACSHFVAFIVCLKLIKKKYYKKLNVVNFTAFSADL